MDVPTNEENPKPTGRPNPQNKEPTKPISPTPDQNNQLEDPQDQQPSPPSDSKLTDPEPTLPKSLAEDLLSSEEPKSQTKPKFKLPTLPKLPERKAKPRKERKTKGDSKIKEKLSGVFKKTSKKLKNKFLSMEFVKKEVPHLLGYFFLLLGLSSSFGEPFTEMVMPGLSYAEISWIYLFIGVDLIGFFALPLLLIHWNLLNPLMKVGSIAPFQEYGLVYQNLFICKEVNLFQFLGADVFLPCSGQILIFYVWLFSVLLLFSMRYAPFDKMVYTLGQITANYFYLVLFVVKVVALGVILVSSTPFGFFGSALIAMSIIILDFMAINLAIKKKSGKPTVKYSVS